MDEPRNRVVPIRSTRSTARIRHSAGDSGVALDPDQFEDAVIPGAGGAAGAVVDGAGVDARELVVDDGCDAVDEVLLDVDDEVVVVLVEGVDVVELDDVLEWDALLDP